MTRRAARVAAFTVALGVVFAPMAAFEQGLRDLEWLNGENIAIEYCSADANLDRLPALAAELVGLRVDVIVALSFPVSRPCLRS